MVFMLFLVTDVKLLRSILGKHVLVFKQCPCRENHNLAANVNCPPQNKASVTAVSSVSAASVPPH